MTILVAALMAVAAGQAPEPAMPHRKPGLWQSEIVSGDKTTTLQQCFDDAFESAMEKVDKDKCTDRYMRHNSDGSWTVSATCKIMLFIKSSTRSEISGDFQSKLKIVTYDLPDNTLKATTTSKWIGACKPGQKGGDMILPNGMKINVLSVMGN